MESFECKARAKINLSLDVLEKRGNGYHDVRMIMQTVNFGDFVTLSKNSYCKIDILSNNKYAPSNEKNTMYKAADLLRQTCGIKDGVNITLQKKTPISAGLGGGSADAAAVLKGMNILFDLGFTLDELASLGKSVGADIPFCIYGGTMLAEGIGEKLTPLNPLPPALCLIVKPKINISTRWVYNALVASDIVNHPDTDLLLNYVKKGDIAGLAANMKNVLEEVTAKKYPIIEYIKKQMIELGALGSIMSGSGSSVFGIFDDKDSLDKCFKFFNVKHEYHAISTTFASKKV
jgi:4-diphosphocytidyl-2-C-methyl-D-erythritol kinase